MEKKEFAIPEQLDGSGLRILIVHARWNATIVDALVQGAKETMIKQHKVHEKNIIIQSVPGSWELPIAVSRLIAASQIQSSANANDLLGASSLLEMGGNASSQSQSISTLSRAPFDAVIAIGCLIKGDTMHFEYISNAVTTGLMRVGLDTGLPVILGILTTLTEDQANIRAGISNSAPNGGHNHGIDWGHAAVEMAVKKSAWAHGQV